MLDGVRLGNERGEKALSNEERQLHEARLEIAIAILSDKKPMNEPKRILLRSIVKIDNMVDRVLRMYDVIVE